VLVLVLVLLLVLLVVAGAVDANFCVCACACADNAGACVVNGYPPPPSSFPADLRKSETFDVDDVVSMGLLGMVNAQAMTDMASLNALLVTAFKPDAAFSPRFFNYTAVALNETGGATGVVSPAPACPAGPCCPPAAPCCLLCPPPPFYSVSLCHCGCPCP
jgi:hypothetical protein